MDRRLMEYQLRVIEIKYRAQQPRGELRWFRAWAYQMLDGLGREAIGDPELLARISRVRHEVSGQG